MKPAIFLDRDGVIIENRETYVQSWADVEIFEQALYGLKKYVNAPYYFIIITNQSAVGRGIITLKQAREINKKLVRKINNFGGRIEAFYMCPHAPTHGCDCRKPNTGLIQQAVSDFNIDLKNSILIGDAITDLQAGQNAGIGKLVLVRTGRGKKQLQLPSARQLQFIICDDLLDAFNLLL